MIIDVGYWTKVLKRLFIIILTIILIYLTCKLAVFYMPFLIAFIISLLIEPLIKFTVKKTKFTRKISAIIVLIIVFSILIGLFIWGITSLITEANHLLLKLNEYFEKAKNLVNHLISGFEFEKMQIPQEIKNILSESSFDFLEKISQSVKSILNSLINAVTKVPIIGINIVITILSTYFICTDKVYILDQIEHHMPKRWVKKIGLHLRQIISSLGNYLKAEVILILIAFGIVTIGLFIFNIMGLNVQYPLLAALGISFVDALPILGSGTILIPWAIISGINGDITLAISIIGLYVVLIITRQLLEPKIISKHIGIHPIFTLIAMYTGFKINGVIGLIVGPIILIILRNIFTTLIDNGIVKTIFDRR